MDKRINANFRDNQRGRENYRVIESVRLISGVGGKKLMNSSGGRSGAGCYVGVDNDIQNIF